MDYTQFIATAIAARDKAYAPYSQFKVGAVLVGANGELFSGCNVENVAFSPSNCAERTALFRAISDGYAPRSFQALVVIADTDDPIAPCGVCRQVMMELCDPQMRVIQANLNGQIRETTVAQLLPDAFQAYQA